MPELKQYFATNTYRPDESGFAAFETFGRRVGSEYGRAASDIKEIGRTKAATINMLGRWPFNILELEKRESERAMRSSPQSQSRPMGGVVTRPSSSGITDSQFGARYMPDLAALNEMSEGAAYFGRMVSGSPSYGRGYSGPGSQYGNLTDLRLRREYEEAKQQAIEERERERQEQLEEAAYQKRWDLYERNLDKYNEKIQADAQKASPYGVYGTSNDPSSPYADPNSINFPTSTYIPSGEAYEPAPTYGGTYQKGVSDTPSPSEGGTYGGNPTGTSYDPNSSSWYNPTSWF